MANDNSQARLNGSSRAEPIPLRMGLGEAVCDAYDSGHAVVLRYVGTPMIRAGRCTQWYRWYIWTLVERRSWHHAQQNAWRSTDGHVVIASERDDLDVVAL